MRGLPVGPRPPHRSWTALGLVALGLVALAACGTDDRPPSWSYIHAAIIGPNCTSSSCHATGTATYGIDLADADRAYQTLAGRACGSTDPVVGYISPDDPEASYVVNLLRNRKGIRRPMPPDRLLPKADVDLVVAWIAKGAPCD